MGLDAVTGSLEAGKSADIIALDTTGLAMTPGHQVDSDIVYASSGTEVSWSWIAGKNVLKNRQLQTLDKEALSDKARSGALNSPPDKNVYLTNLFLPTQ